jgi:hypothetical protein
VSGLPAKPGHSNVRRAGYQAGEQEIVLVRDVSSGIAPGEIASLAGESGRGQTRPRPAAQSRSRRWARWPTSRRGLPLPPT